MPYRALIIGIEDYPAVDDGSLARSLPGTLDAAAAFRDWLSEKWRNDGVPEADTHMIVCTEPAVAEGRPASARAILSAIKEFKDLGQGATDEFYFFFSGHGFSFVDAGMRADILVTSDFESLPLSGNACFNLNRTIYWLRQHLGPGRHYYFVDACRNLLDETQIVPTGFLLPNDPQLSSEASSFVLQSVEAGSVAVVDKAFPNALISGLLGDGDAKTWDEDFADAMVVRFDTLWRHLEKKLRPRRLHGAFEGTQGPEKAIYSVLRPVPESDCIVEIVEELPAATTIECSGMQSGKLVRASATGRRTTIRLPADRYWFSAYDATGHKIAGPIQMKVYEDTSVCLKPEVVAGVSQPDAPLSGLSATSGASVEARKLERTSAEIRQRGLVRTPRRRGKAPLSNNRSKAAARPELDVGGDGRFVGGAVDWSKSVPHVSIADWFEKTAEGIWFSESLEAAVLDPDLDLWLAIIGAGNILRSGEHLDYLRIGALPLQDFAGLTVGSACIYILGGFADVGARLDVGLTGDVDTTWRTAKGSGMDGIRECLLEVDPGPVLVSLRLDGNVSITVASFAIRNMASFVTLTTDFDGSMRVSQYIVSIGSLRDDPTGARLRGRNQLLDIKKLASAQKAFRARRDIAAHLTEEDVSDLRAGRWTDPLMASLVAYDHLRRGRATDASMVVEAAARNDVMFPDFEAVRLLAQGDVGQVAAVPIFLDGLRAFNTENLPLPDAYLDYGSPWTSWKGAVKR